MCVCVFGEGCRKIRVDIRRFGCVSNFVFLHLAGKREVYTVSSVEWFCLCVSFFWALGFRGFFEFRV